MKKKNTKETVYQYPMYRKKPLSPEEANKVLKKRGVIKDG